MHNTCTTHRTLCKTHSDIRMSRYDNFDTLHKVNSAQPYLKCYKFYFIVHTNMCDNIHILHKTDKHSLKIHCGK